MKRREFIGTGMKAAAGVAAGAALLNNTARAQAGSKPNIIIMLADDMGYGDVGCYGSRAISTPNLDRMAGQGAKLTNFFSSAAVCSPSRAGLLTGRYPIRTGITQVLFPPGNPVTGYNRMKGVPEGLPESEITIAEALKPAGYSTCCIGKWHLGDHEPFLPNNNGFDRFMGLLWSNDMRPLSLYRNREVIEKDPVNQDNLTKKYTAEALEFINSAKNNPFFIYFAQTFPHRPLHASADFRGRSKAGLYGDCIEEIDWSMGQIMTALDHHGLADNTLIFFTSDNGPWFQGSPGIYRGRKSETFDGGMRVPLITRWPAFISPGLVSDQMGMNFDLFATSLAAAGVPIPKDRAIDGRSMLGVLKGEASPHEALYYYHGTELEAVRWQNWKYHSRHRVMMPPFVKHGPWLFNLEDDPNESYNVIDKYPDVAKKLEGMMRDWEQRIINDS